MVLGLRDSRTPRLWDSQTPGLPGSPGLRDSQGVFRLGSSHQWKIFSSDYKQNLPNMKMGAKMADSARGDGNFLNVTLASND